MMNSDDLIRFHQDLLNQQRDHRSIQKETIKLVAMLSKNVNIHSVFSLPLSFLITFSLR
jgi:hypothetical protein